MHVIFRTFLDVTFPGELPPHNWNWHLFPAHTCLVVNKHSHELPICTSVNAKHDLHELQANRAWIKDLSFETSWKSEYNRIRDFLGFVRPTKKKDGLGRWQKEKVSRSFWLFFFRRWHFSWKNYTCRTIQSFLAVKFTLQKMIFQSKVTTPTKLGCRTRANLIL